MSEGEVVFSKDGYKIERVGVLYNVYSPEGNFIFGNRESLREAQSDLKSYISAGGEGAYQYIFWRGSKVPVLSIGGFYDVSQLDEEIKDLVLDLNFQGFTTIGSCAGHSRSMGGFISFLGELDPDEISDVRNIFNAHGITNVKFALEWHEGENYTEAKFPPLGKRV